MQDQRLQCFDAGQHARARQKIRSQDELRLLTFEAAVMIEIATFKALGGPQDYHIEEVQRLRRQIIDNGGDTSMLFGGKHAGVEMAIWCKALAVLAFQPGGVNIAGLHFEAEAPEREGEKTDGHAGTL